MAEKPVLTRFFFREHNRTGKVSARGVVDGRDRNLHVDVGAWKFQIASICQSRGCTVWEAAQSLFIDMAAAEVLYSSIERGPMVETSG